VPGLTDQVVPPTPPATDEPAEAPPDDTIDY
jgi:hypothetical protein